MSERMEMEAAYIMERWRPGSQDEPWGWTDEAADIRLRECACCGQDGHYLQQLESAVSAEGFKEPVVLGDDGRVWDGHHRIIIGRRLRLAVPVVFGYSPVDN